MAYSPHQNPNNPFSGYSPYVPVIGALWIATMIYVLYSVFNPSKNDQQKVTAAIIEDKAKGEAAMATEATVWKALLDDFTTCSTENTAQYFDDYDHRILALYAAARFNCAQIAADLISKGVLLEDNRFIGDKVTSLDEYATKYKSDAVLEVFANERIRREKDLAAVNKKLEQIKQAEERSQLNEIRKKELATQAFIAEQLELKKSIHFGQSKVDCEVLRDKLGFSVSGFDMNACIRKGIEQRRNARAVEGHIIPP